MLKSQKWSNFPNGKQIHSPSKKKQQYFRRGVAKIEKCERHAGREAKKKTNATQQENNIFDFLNTPSARRRFLSKMGVESRECLNLCGEAGG